MRGYYAIVDCGARGAAVIARALVERRRRRAEPLLGGAAVLPAAARQGAGAAAMRDAALGCGPLPRRGRALLRQRSPRRRAGRRRRRRPPRPGRSAARRRAPDRRRAATHRLLDAQPGAGAAAVEGGADYIGFGPIFDSAARSTPTRPSASRRCATVAAASPVPVVAIGGIALDVGRVRRRAPARPPPP